MSAEFRTPLSRARGLGSAKHGATHWVAERVSAIALVPLVLWAVFGVIRLAAGDYGVAVDWVGQPLNAVLLVLLVAVAFWHMATGVRVIIEDYIHKMLTKTALLLANMFIAVLAGGLAIFSILKVALGGAL
ncbi:MAG TPA: succinate dehydrogenase, hydrophobic membrane anchor protein [Phenylobacterium sp.]|jgi:succinate dehydrogenase / fumarate reductase membrane anchor subunit|uniref:Succinate dehydrogenase hydrophobic membrane anchor subunit n=1 Tax=Phenylobacterium conjunctum TaxID=1298959 RepID=A0ABW3T525_9CAUL|nr:succinate dehydrogenase, hydrophobic membrane anchor protein [Phenylobacterium sp.]HQN49715.1 succinate dehydrogenase, hydrophobic membrane anchor protein [Phenylobacterium sp.]HQP21571.1 succinate dehydrogenase, hydrophobic membrane anchor protein [Phenylobacterium sp.]